MKIFGLVLALVTLASSSLFASSITCENEETKVTLKQVAPEVYAARVEMESSGGGRPQFDFKNIMVAEMANRPGAPKVYAGVDFRLTINYTTLHRIAVLTVPSLGLENEQLLCK